MDEKKNSSNPASGRSGWFWAALIALWAGFVYVFFFVRFIANYFQWRGGG